MNDQTDDLKAAEERKREAAWDAAERWRVRQETMTWVEAKLKVRRNPPQRCLELQREKLADEG